MPSVKVPNDLHGRLTHLAATEGLTIGGVIRRSLDALEEGQFWAAVEQTMVSPAPQASAEQFAGALKDGLDPDETWEGLL